MTRFHAVLVTCALGLGVASGSQQASAQASPTATGPGKSAVVGGAVSAFHVAYGDRWLAAPEVFVDANLWWRVGIEGEARWLRYNQELDTHASTYLVGPRYTFSPRRTEPYLKAFVGRGEFSFPYHYARGSYAVVGGGGGVDLHLNSRVQLRLIDVEYQRWLQFTYGSMPSYGISTGIAVAIWGAHEH